MWERFDFKNVKLQKCQCWQYSWTLMWSCIPVCHQERGPHPDSSAPSRSGTPLFLCTEYAVVASCVFHVSIPPLPTIQNNRYIQICSFSIEIINIVKYIHICVMVRPVPSPVPDSRLHQCQIVEYQTRDSGGLGSNPGLFIFFAWRQTLTVIFTIFILNDSRVMRELSEINRNTQCGPPPFPKDLISYE